MEYENFSSLPPHEEAQFAVFEERSVKNATTARNLAIGVAAPIFFILVINYFTNRSEEKSLIVDDPAAEVTPARVAAPPQPPVPAVPAAPAAAPAAGDPAAAPAAAPAPGAAPAAGAVPAAGAAPAPVAAPAAPGAAPAAAPVAPITPDSKPPARSVSPKDLGKKRGR